LAAFATVGTALAAPPVAVNDAFTARSGILLQVEAPGVMENDYDFGGEPPPPPSAVASLASPASFGVLVLNGDGSFDYTSNVGFFGVDTFSYSFADSTGTSNIATVAITVNGCEAGVAPTQWVCWVEGAYLAKAAELGLSTFFESFEDDVAWAIARSPDTAPSVTSRSITWASNFSFNNITTGYAGARSGNWGIYSLPHGDQSGPFGTPIHDGFTGTASSPDALLGVGGWLVGSQIGSSADLIVSYDGGATVTANFPNHTLDYSHRFFGFIDTAGFTSFEVVETNGTVGQPFFVFADDFSFVVPGSDSTPPRVVEIGSWEDTGDGVLSEGEITDVLITQLMVRFSEPVQDPPGDSDPDDVTNPANYLLFDDGGDGFDTIDCAGGIAAGDNPITVEVWEYLSGDPSQTWLGVNGGLELPAGSYRLLVCGTTSIVDWAGNVLDGDGNGTGGDDFVRNFSVASAAVPVISIGDVAVVEGDVGTTDAVFTISLSTTSDSQVSVTYATVGGTATSGVDYLPAGGTAVFPPQTLTQTITVLVVGDLDPEADETYTVELTAPVNATMGDPSGAGTIIDDDAWTWFVAPDGNDLNDCLTTTTACLTISEAVSRAAAGDQIKVARGVYGEHLTVTSDLTLLGETPMGTVIDGGGIGTVVSIGPGANVTMQGFEIRGGGIGGISNDGALVLSNSWVHGNGDGLASSFGGLANQGTALVDRVAISNNMGETADGVSNSGQLTVLNSTIAENNGAGGLGIDNLPGAGLDLLYSTVAANGSLGIGVGDPGATSMRGTIVAGHTTANCDGAVVTMGHNLEDRNTCGLDPASNDLIATDPLLAPLAHHGGSSPTMALATASPAVDAAETVGLPASDQRGVGRPLDGDLDGTPVGDIGAYELRPGAIFDDGFESGDTSAWN
jgi:hypothetical protein